MAARTPIVSCVCGALPIAQAADILAEVGMGSLFSKTADGVHTHMVFLHSDEALYA